VKVRAMDEQYYIQSRPLNDASEQGLSIGTGVFEREANEAIVDFTGDDDKSMQRGRNLKTWDRKKKRFVGQTDGGGDNKKRKNESGARIGATGYKRHMYQDWVDKNKINHNDDDEEGGNGRGGRGGYMKRGSFRGENQLTDYLQGSLQYIILYVAIYTQPLGPLKQRQLNRKL